MCLAKTGNIHDQYAVVVGKNGTVVGNLARKVSRVCTLFHCGVTGRQIYSVDLRQRSVRVELRYSDSTFRGSNFLWCFNFRGFNFRGFNFCGFNFRG